MNRMLSVAALLSLINTASAGVRFTTFAKAAFVKVGEAESDGTAFEPKRANRINARQLNTAIHRVLLLDARPEMGVEFPTGDLLNRQDANVAIYIDGVDINSSMLQAMPFLQSVFNAHEVPSYSIGSSSKSSSSSVLYDSLSNVDAANLAGIICGSVDDALFNTVVCQSSNRLQLTGLFDASVHPIEAAHNKELSLLSELSDQIFSGKSTDKPKLFVAYLSSLHLMSAEYGISNEKTLTAASAIDDALRSLIRPTDDTNNIFVTAQIVAGAKLKDVLSISKQPSRRRLQSSSTATSTATSSASDAESILVDIKQFQLNMWTGVFLALIVFFSIYGIVNMDIGRDSLLYAKFQADTSGKND